MWAFRSVCWWIWKAMSRAIAEFGRIAFMALGLLGGITRGATHTIAKAAPRRRPDRNHLRTIASSAAALLDASALARRR
ncbi:hypothetical protein STHU_28630 [Allostella humosa]|nr:hypothetical protein STHU_28630 [Stella humosa]